MRQPHILILSALLITLTVSVTRAHADLQLARSYEGDHWIYLPTTTHRDILVIAHGMYNENEHPDDVAKRFIKRWIQFSEKHGLILIAPVFDDSRFGTLSQGYGGYRNLFGKYVNADIFVQRLVKKYGARISNFSESFYLYGHSAGAQFVVRYAVAHPKTVKRAVASAAGRFSYPSMAFAWPYGAGPLRKRILWDKGSIVRNVEVSRDLYNYAIAANKLAIVIGARDTKPQDARPAHTGRNRIEFSQSWAQAMNQNADRFGLPGTVSVTLVPSVGHDSEKLTPSAMKAFKLS